MPQTRHEQLQAGPMPRLRFRGIGKRLLERLVDYLFTTPSDDDGSHATVAVRAWPDHSWVSVSGDRPVDYVKCTHEWERDKETVPDSPQFHCEEPATIFYRINDVDAPFDFDYCALCDKHFRDPPGGLLDLCQRITREDYICAKVMES